MSGGLTVGALVGGTSVQKGLGTLDDILHAERLADVRVRARQGDGDVLPAFQSRRPRPVEEPLHGGVDGRDEATGQHGPVVHDVDVDDGGGSQAVEARGVAR